MQPHIFEPSPALAPFVKCYWTLESEADKTPKRNTIVPDGCMKFIFHYGDPYKHYTDNGEVVVLPKCFLIGQLTKPYEVEPSGNTGTFFVCFHPGGFFPFATFPIKEMENTAVPLEVLFGKEGRVIATDILDAPNAATRIDLIENFLLRRLSRKDVANHIIMSTVEAIVSAKGQIGVETLSKQTKINRRQLARKFSSDIGLSPKQLARIIKIQATLKKLLNNEVTTLTDLTYELNYYDQAHFIKDFKEFTGLTPKEFYGDHLKMSLIFDKKD